jgi:hypothetical protein
MRPSILGLLFACALSALSAGPAQAITCFLVYDRNDNLIFQDTFPPIDLSDRGAAERDAMYGRGEHLIEMEADHCPTIQFLTGAGGTSALSVDQVVGGMQASAIPTGSGARTRATAARAAPPPKARASKNY